MKSFDSIERALKYVDSHLSEQMGYERLANILHFSPYYFHRMFSLVVGKTITAHIRDRRLEKACAMLSSTQKGTLEICLDCGFEAYSTFSRIFKNKYGLSPKEYRKQGYAPVCVSIEELITTLKEKLEGREMSDTILKEIEKLSKKIELEPNNWENVNTRGHLHYDVDEFEKSVIDLTKAIALRPNIAENYFVRGCSYHNLGKYGESIADYTKAIELNSENPQYYFGRGMAYRFIGEYEKAVNDFTKAIEFESNEAAYDYCERGRAYHFMDESEKAHADFAKAFELDPAIVKEYEDMMTHYKIAK